MTHPQTNAEERAADIAPELLPCPFCGSAALIIEDGARFFATCEGADCFCCVGESYGTSEMADHNFESSDDAAKAWNRRADLVAAKDAEIAQLRKALTTTKEACAQIAENPGFIQAQDTEWDIGVNYAKTFIAKAIRAALEPS